MCGNNNCGICNWFSGNNCATPYFNNGCGCNDNHCC